MLFFFLWFAVSLWAANAVSQDQQASENLSPNSPAYKEERISTIARQFFLKDLDANQILAVKKENERMHPASMTKMMVAYIIFDMIKEGALSFEEKFSVSRKARQMRGSRTFLEEGSQVSVIDLLRGIIIQSGNDASIVLAEGIAGSEEAFVEIMNQRADRMGMENTNFVNSSGWPDPEHYSTARDIATLAERTIRDFPEYYLLYSEKEFQYNGINQFNRNPLLFRNIGTDGLKTGHTEVSGYGLVSSTEQNGRRILLVVHGLDSMRARALESERLTRLAFARWESFTVYERGETIATLPVWLGRRKQMELVTRRDIVIALSREDKKNLLGAVEYQTPMRAPIVSTKRIAWFVLEGENNREIKRIPLFAREDIEQKNALGRLPAVIKYLLAGAMPK